MSHAVGRGAIWRLGISHAVGHFPLYVVNIILRHKSGYKTDLFFKHYDIAPNLIIIFIRYSL